MGSPRINPEWEKLGPEADLHFCEPGPVINIPPADRPHLFPIIYKRPIGPEGAAGDSEKTEK